MIIAINLMSNEKKHVNKIINKRILKDIDNLEIYQ